MKIICLSLLFALAVASPLERQTEGGLVVDVPAGAFEPDSAEVTRDVPVGASVEQVDVSEKDTEKEPGRVPLNRDPDSDFFGFRFPTFPSLFVYRRPVIRDPFSSLSGFQQPQPQPYAPGQFDAFSHMETMMQRMQQQMSALWGALLNPGYTVRPRPPVIAEEPVLPGDTAAVDETDKSVIKIGDLPANYSNSTSETKVIDGQVVEVNKTIHKVTSNDSSGFFHFQVIKIRPKEPVTDMPTGSVPTEVAHESAGSAPTEAKPESSAAPAFETNEQTTARTPEDPSMNEVDGQHQRQQEVSHGIDQGLLDDKKDA